MAIWLYGSMAIHVEVWLARSVVDRMRLSWCVGGLCRQSVIVANATIRDWEEEDEEAFLAQIDHNRDSNGWLSVCASLV